MARTKTKSPRIALVSVPELARDLDMPINKLYYYLGRLKVRTNAMSSAPNSVRFLRRGDVPAIVAALNAYRKRQVPGLSTAQVAERLGILPSTVRTLVAQKRLVPRRAGRYYSFDPSDVDAYANGRRRRIA